MKRKITVNMVIDYDPSDGLFAKRAREVEIAGLLAGLLQGMGKWTMPCSIKIESVGKVAFRHSAKKGEMMTVDKLIEDGLIDPARKLDAVFFGVIYDHFEETGDESLDPVLKALAMQFSYTLAQIPKKHRRKVMGKISAAILCDASAIEKNMRDPPDIAAMARPSNKER